MRRQLLAGLRMIAGADGGARLVYPLAVTGISQFTMSNRANGSLVRSDGTVVGSELLAQAFEGDQWFQPRPGSYDPTASGASNLGPNNPDLIDTVGSAVDAVRKRDDVDAGTPILPMPSRPAGATSTRTSPPRTRSCRHHA